MKVNPYNWSKQSRDHLEFARQNYPTIAALVVRSNGYPAYALGAQGLRTNARQRYVAEWRDWYDRFGRSWERMGGLRERRFGQITTAHRFVPTRGRLGALGALSPPSPPSGYHVCSKAPAGGLTASGPVQESNVVGWRYQQMTGVSGAAAGLTFYVVWEITGPYQEVFWYPNSMSCGGAAKATEPSVVYPAPAPLDVPESVSASAGISPWLLVIAGGALIGGVLYARKKKARK
jgi:hypothetical protein